MMILTNDEKTILIWSFYDAPKQLQELSPHGGDEDWIAYLPPHYEKDVPMFLDNDYGSRFGVCDTSVHDMGDGSLVLIGAHA